MRPAPQPEIASSISSRDDVGRLDHENHRRLGCAGAMDDTPRHDERLTRSELDDSARGDTIRGGFQVDEKEPIETEEEFVVGVVVGPVVLALHDAEPNDGIVDPDERLVPPLIAHAGDYGRERDLLESREEDVEVRRVGKAGAGIGSLSHGRRSEMEWGRVARL